MSVHKLANILYCHIHPNCSRKSLLCPCMAKKFTDNSWTIHHSEKYGKNPKYPLTNKCISKWCIHIVKVKVKFAQTCPTLCYSVEFSRPEYWSGELFPSPGDLSNSGIEPKSPTLQVDSLPAEKQGKLKILDWVAYPFSRGSSWPRNQTRVSYVAGGYHIVEYYSAL